MNLVFEVSRSPLLSRKLKHSQKNFELKTEIRFLVERKGKVVKKF